MLLVARVHVESLAVVLDSEDGPPVIHAGLSGLTGVARKYPETLNVRVAVRGGAVTAPEGNLLHAGVAMPKSPSMPRAPKGQQARCCAARAILLGLGSVLTSDGGGSCAGGRISAGS